MHPPPDASRTVHIPTSSEKRGLEWSLALVSQDIPCILHPPAPPTGWTLEVHAQDARRALHTLRLYVAENRRPPPALTPALGELIFHWGVVSWCLILLLVHVLSLDPHQPWRTAGVFDTVAWQRGDWWRPLTATFLHAGPGHLAANLTTGFLLLGLAMGRFGVGPTLLGSLLAGTAANLLAWLVRGHDYVGLGASAVVLGALGLLAVSIILDTRAQRLSLATLGRSLLGGLLLFILLGTSPESDVLAHAAGMAAGVALGLPLALLPARLRTHPAFDLSSTLLYLALPITCWWFALR